MKSLALKLFGITIASALLHSPQTQGQTNGPVQLVAKGAVWKYLADGSDQGTAWRTNAFNHYFHWPSGPSQLGYGEGDEETVIPSGVPGAAPATVYFRRAFFVPNSSIFKQLTLNLLRDDGAVVYLNGVEVFRDNMPSGPIACTNWAANVVGGEDESTFFPHTLSPGLLISGTNLLAVEVHQANPVSADLSFNLELLGYTILPTNWPPTVRMVTPTNGQIFTAPANIMVAAQANDQDGYLTVRTVEFFEGTNSLGIATNGASLDPLGPFVTHWTSVPAGQYRLTAKATDATGASVVSEPVNVFVKSSGTPNIVTIEAKQPLATEMPPWFPNFTPILFALHREGSVAQPLAVAYSVGGTASNGIDYAELSGLALFEAGASNATIAVLLLDDDLVEGTETVEIHLLEMTFQGASQPSPYLVGTPGMAAASILDDETPPPAVSITASDPYGSEKLPFMSSVDDAAFLATRTGDASQAIEVPFVISGSASPGLDYRLISALDHQLSSGWITFPAGVTNATLLIDPIYDTWAEGTETAVIQLLPLPPGSPVFYTLAQPSSATAYIKDFDAGTNIARGFLKWEVYTNIPGILLSDLTNNPAFPDDSSLVNYITSFETPSQYGDNFGARVSGYLLPPSTGDYIFYLACDDQGTLLLSPDELPAHKVQIIFEPGFTPSRQWSAAPKSQPIHLEAGQRYYIEALQKEGGGGDNLAVTWRKPETAPPTNGAPPIPSQFLAPPVDYLTNRPPIVTLFASDPEASEPVFDDLGMPLADPGMFTIQREGDPSEPLAVWVNIAGTAANGADYSEIGRRILIPAGEDRVDAQVWPLTDRTSEDPETVVLSLVANPTYLVGSPNTATVTIHDFTPPLPAVVNVVATDPAAEESGLRNAIFPGQFTILRDGRQDMDLPVYFTLSGTAINGVDYGFITNQVIIPAGQTQTSINVFPLNDNLLEGAENVVLTLESPVCIDLWPPPPECYRVGLSNQATVFITEWHITNPQPSITITKPAEGAIFEAPATIPIEALTQDPDGYFNSAEFFANGVKIGQITVTFLVAPPPGKEIRIPFTWTSVAPGSYTLTARTRNHLGHEAVSPPVHITVRETPPPNELHVVGIYSGVAPGGSYSKTNELGEAAVFVDRPDRRVTLFLNAYEPVRWHIKSSSNTLIEKVFLVGCYQPQVVGLPPGTEVVFYDSQVGHKPYLWVGEYIESRQFYSALPRVHALTGMEISSFYGTSLAPYPNPIVINGVQDDPRLRSDYPQPTPLSQLPANPEFQISFYSESAGVFQRNYTLAGPQDDTQLLPALPVVNDIASDARYYYGIAGGGSVLEIDSQTGTVREINSQIPGLSWPMGLTYDPEHYRMLLVTLGGEGALYAHYPGDAYWQTIASMENRDLSGLAYHEDNETIYGFSVTSYEGGRPQLLNFSDGGTYLNEHPFPFLPFGTGPGYRSFLVSAGKYLVALFAPERAYYPGSGDIYEERIYLIEPQSGQSWLAYRKILLPDNQPPTVAITSPNSSATFPVGASISLVATARDQDGLVQSVQFFADGQPIGFGNRSSLDPYADGYIFEWPNAQPGTYSLTARATDNQGAQTDSASVQITVQALNPLPVVAISAPISIAKERTRAGDTKSARFKVRRAGATNENLMVYYAIGGTAENGVDYERLEGFVTIPAGSRKAFIQLKPVDDSIPEDPETVILTLWSQSGYQLGETVSAAAVIMDNDSVKPPTGTLPGRLVQVNLSAGGGATTYRVECSTNLHDWVTLQTDATPQDGAIHFVDPNSPDLPYRFYRAVPVISPASLEDE